MFVPNTRQPLLPVPRRRPQHLQSGTSSSKQSSTLIWLIFTVIAVSLIFSHLFLPSLREKDTLSQQSIDREHELYVLHHDPSPHFCSLPRRPLVCAHGGDLEMAPPNTLAAFQAALDGGADCVEVDVSMTKDGQLVALHDRDLGAVLDGGDVTRAPSSSLSLLHQLPFWNRRLASHASKQYHRVGDYTWDQLSKLQWNTNNDDDGSLGISLVKDVIELLLSSPLEISITLDIKLKETLQAELMAQSVYDILQITNCGNYCMTWAKSDAYIAAIKSLDHRQRVGLIVLNETSAALSAGMHEPLRLPHLDAEVVGVHYRMASAELTNFLKKAGREVHLWTANTAEMMKSALDAGPDAVVTSYPRKLLAALQARAAACARERRKPL